jgi:sugar lactone lactonase YvrE
MQNKQTESKLRPGIGLTRHFIGGVLCLAVISLICARASAQNLFAVDRDPTGGGIIDEFTPNGVRSIFTSGLNNPSGLAFDKAGNLFVADAVAAGSSVVYKFTPAGVRTTFASGLAYPAGLAFDRRGNLFVAAGGSIYEFTPTGARTTFAFVRGAGGLAASGLAFDRPGNLFVTGGRNLIRENIYKVTPTGVRTTFASGLVVPFALAFDRAGNLFVADGGYDTCECGSSRGAGVYKFTPSGVRSTVASVDDQVSVIPYSLAIDGTDNLFVSDSVSGNILKFTPRGVRTTFAARLVTAMAFQPSPTSSPTPTPIGPAVSVMVSPTLVHKGETAVFTISLSAPSANAATVSYTMAGRAKLDRHYTLSGSPGQVTIPAGANSADVILTCLRANRRPKTATMVAVPGATYNLSASSSASVTIRR